MINRITLADEYYHQKYPGFLVFYRLDNNYVAFQNDAVRAAKVLRRTMTTYEGNVSCLKVDSFDFLDVVGFLSMCGMSVKGIIFRDESGKYAIPDVKIIKEDNEADY